MSFRTVALHPAPPRRLIAGLVALALAVASLAVASPVQAAGGSGLRAEVNGYRSNAGLKPVAGTALLDDITAKRAAQMVALNDLEHDMDYVRSRLTSAGVCYTGFGEIIAHDGGGAYSYDATVRQWWNSDPHRKVMMGSHYNAAGGAWATHSSGRHYSVMVFVAMCSAPSATTTTSQLGIKLAYDPDKKVLFKAGDHVGYKLSSSGSVLGSKRYRLGSSSGANTQGRTVVNGRAYLKIANGIWAGYWVPETSRSYVMGTAWSVSYSPARKLAFAAGTHTGYKFDSAGRVTARKSYTLARGSSASTTGVAIINGLRHYRIANGVWGGYWVRDTAGVWPL
jgi:uncharacterized protein YkwD